MRIPRGRRWIVPVLLIIGAAVAFPRLFPRSGTPYTRWLAAKAMAQSSHLELPNKVAPRKLTVVVDGKLHPELITDERAYTHFLRATVGDTDAAKARSESLIARVGLSDDDQAVLTNVGRQLGERLIPLARQRLEAVQASSAAEYDGVRLRERDAEEAAIAAVLVQLSPEGRGRLDAFIQEHVKSKITIYGGPMRAGH